MRIKVLPILPRAALEAVELLNRSSRAGSFWNVSASTGERYVFGNLVSLSASGLSSCNKTEKVAAVVCSER